MPAAFFFDFNFFTRRPEAARKMHSFVTGVTLPIVARNVALQDLTPDLRTVLESRAWQVKENVGGELIKK